MKVGKKKKELDFSKYKFEIYGTPGAGKTTLASKFPKAFFIPTEAGINYLECDTLLDDNDNPIIIKSWDEFKKAVIFAVKQKEYKTIVIDTIDNAVKFCSSHVLKRRNIEHESDEDYGKGWSLVQKELEGVIDYLVNSGFGVVFISHEKEGQREEKGVKRVWIDNSLGSKAKNYINGMVDFIFYCYLDDDGNRLMRTKQTLNYNAKDRTGLLPEVMPMDFKLLEKEISKSLKGDKK